MLVSSRPNSAETGSQDELRECRDHGGGGSYPPHSDCTRAEARTLVRKAGQAPVQPSDWAGDSAPSLPSSSTTRPPPTEVAKGLLHPWPAPGAGRKTGWGEGGQRCGEH